jgi:myxalamid-type polyketide synthase MxaE and MxaD
MSQDRTSPEASSTKRALRALQEMQVRLAELEGQARDPIAIVGMGCRFPGARHLDAFWEMLENGRDGITEVPPDRWDINSLYHPDSSVPGTVMTRWGGFLDELDQFDAQFFGISPREAPHVDPRQRLMLEVVWEALEDAGIPPDNLAGTDTGVFFGVLTNDYDQLVSKDLTRFQVYTGIGTANSIVANRISYFLDLHGPSLVIDTACSGSLLATDLACRSLRAGQTSLAIAGGVAVNLQPNGEIFFSRAGSLSKEGKCRTFDSGANGMIRSEGAGVVVLKPFHARLLMAIACMP